MSRTRKTDRARAIHAPDVVRKTGETDRKPKRHHAHVELMSAGQGRIIDDGGVRHGNNRATLAGRKVLARRSLRHVANRLVAKELE